MPTILKHQPRRVLAVNLDQTLSHTLEALVKWHNDTYSTHLTIEDFDTYDFAAVWGGSQESTCDKIRAFYDSEYFERIPPIQDFALEALKMFKKRKFTLVIITSRQQFVAAQTKQFVDRHYPGLFESIYFCNLGLSNAEQLEYVSKSKATICKEVGVDVLIDDSLDHALDCAQLGIKVLLYDRKGQYTWNHLEPNTQASAASAASPVEVEGRHSTNSRLTLTSTSRKLYPPTKTTVRALPSNVKRVTSWKDILAQLPKPRSPLSACYFPEDFECNANAESEESEVSEYEEDFYDGSTFVDQSNQGYETIEIDELTEDELEDEDEDEISQAKHLYADDSWNDTIVWA
ncbi:hypothetical protein J3Q64DRAFT_1319528 [Phycomyces blakesleeanus]|uniref:Uncharacterized protein n=2 Tax=Phycomyces blakesleeanus TaxID=4837 RepID=A0A162Q629_PHYB8|nr:hypothetical protein PHYBLDRAFT_184290 [Phycomyces blakesleeanus NRRL 1555(-)]OAD80426.1 hypothetical protein PHYBLDRAFT_184290 [Phycomyces blakesleeanus NRRL 1555(-)]|eukprot:XP_018298466.1 hypothetical protein PHYBLDRAFT_184290 [Phycomyces blakesleeanus NRRL 1555(-)]